MTEARSGDRISELLGRAPVFDGHNDLAWALRKQVDYDLTARDIAVYQPTLHTDIPRLRAGGVGAQFFSVYVPGTLTGGAAVTATLEQIDCVARIVAAYPETFTVARTAAEVRRAMAGGRIAALVQKRLGRPLEPFDLWYNGFLPRGSIPAPRVPRPIRWPAPAGAGRAPRGTAGRRRSG